MRPTISEEDKSHVKKNDTVHIEDKESIKWIETLKETNISLDSSQTEAITIRVKLREYAQYSNHLRFICYIYFLRNLDLK
ncbi:Transposase [Wolbachia endosymbiont of Cylisticus convexus]|uniref:hypothetical protein n=1 Tax=Wolbachia endosymbiont of Cylisticus convexus TaxID=118728 RepID=UPI000DF6DED0|nr:hypothetical protein Wcon_02209 [Wolbachia endosymbiont of Cylisticus convexus]RDD34476.1 hypothetical protein Wcon_01442 [Wolbachia endosymbiont of Cylisticus convexus]RDD34605.1 Transposase for transposon Tn5 [Wolbachia endosymbiont of Cylisticus convexus]RDD35444.1 Transposase [Wolbachia endosymbiont of Cylisticus convexus]